MELLITIIVVLGVLLVLVFGGMAWAFPTIRRLRRAERRGTVNLRFHNDLNSTFSLEKGLSRESRLSFSTGQTGWGRNSLSGQPHGEQSWSPKPVSIGGLSPETRSKMASWTTGFGFRRSMMQEVLPTHLKPGPPSVKSESQPVASESDLDRSIWSQESAPKRSSTSTTIDLHVPSGKSSEPNTSPRPIRRLPLLPFSAAQDSARPSIRISPTSNSVSPTSAGSSTSTPSPVPALASRSLTPPTSQATLRAALAPLVIPQMHHDDQGLAPTPAKGDFSRWSPDTASAYPSFRPFTTVFVPTPIDPDVGTMKSENIAHFAKALQDGMTPISPCPAYSESRTPTYPEFRLSITKVSVKASEAIPS